MKECQNIEWKESWNDDYLKWICAFANTEGGSLCIGIDDQGKIFPLKNEKKLLEDLPNKIRDVLGIIADVRLVSTDNGDYIRIDIPAYPNLINYHGRFYYRSGSTTQELKGFALHRLLLQRQGTSWDAVTVPNVTINDLSDRAFDIFRHKAVQNKREAERFLNESKLSILENLRLISDGQLTRAAILLFHPCPDKYIFGAKVRIGFFQTDADIIYQDEFSSSLFEQIDQIESVIYTKYLKAYISYNGFQRIEEYLFPKAALREAILNAIIHKNYASFIPIQIKIFEDRIYIYNCGELPENWTVDDLMKPHYSRPYNPLLAGAFFKAGEVETWGRGIEKITDACTQAEVAPPCYEHKGGYALLLNASEKLRKIKEALRLENTSGVPDNESGNGSPKSSPIGSPKSSPKTEDKILFYINQDNGITVLRLSELLGISPRAIKKQLSKLQNLGQVRRVGSSRSGHWEVLKSPDSK